MTLKQEADPSKVADLVFHQKSKLFTKFTPVHENLYLVMICSAHIERNASLARFSLEQPY